MREYELMQQHIQEQHNYAEKTRLLNSESNPSQAKRRFAFFRQNRVQANTQTHQEVVSTPPIQTRGTI